GEDDLVGLPHQRFAGAAVEPRGFPVAGDDPAIGAGDKDRIIAVGVGANGSGERFREAVRTGGSLRSGVRTASRVHRVPPPRRAGAAPGGEVETGGGRPEAARPWAPTDDVRFSVAALTPVVGCRSSIGGASGCDDA